MKTVICISYCIVALSVSYLHAFSKSSEYKLLFVHHQSASFNPNQDVLNPTAIETQREQVQEAIAGSVMKSLVPLSSALNSPHLFTSLLTMTSVLRATLATHLEKMPISELKAFPIIHDVYLAPWKTPAQDDFYSAEKISMNENQFTNFLGVSPGSEKFDVLLTQSLQKLQKKLYKNGSPILPSPQGYGKTSKSGTTEDGSPILPSPQGYGKTSKSGMTDPAFLLAMRSFLFVHATPNVQARFVLRILLGLNPGSFDFITENDRVKLDKVVIPDVANRGGVASLEFDIDLFDKEKPPLLKVSFGELDKFSNGEFLIQEKAKQKYVPRIEGTIKMSYLKSRFGFEKKKLEDEPSKLAINFNFSDFVFLLEKQEVSDLNVLLSPGIRIGTTNYVAGRLHMDSVDKEIQTEINNTLQDEIKKAKDGIMNKIFGERK